MSTLNLDRSIIWHPFSLEKNQEIKIVKAEKAYLIDESGKKYLDLISSWWVNLHGHCNPLIAKAIYKQALELEHVIFSGFTHKPAITLCNKLKDFLPKDLSKFFFSDNGSTAIEVALKMAYRFFHGQKKLFLSFEGGYHGDTFGSMSVGKKSEYHNDYIDLCFEVLTIPFPSSEIDEERCLCALETILKNHGSNICSFILEPLVQGASGMRMCRKEFLNAALKMVKEYDILIIFDEVMTGFYRTGTMFALDQIDTVPDLLCLSKGLTGGFLPLSLTVVKKDIFNVIGAYFPHGHSYTANPLACASANASLELLENVDIDDLVETQKNGLHMLEFVTNKRQTGTITAFDVEKPDELKKKALDKGLIIRPLKNSCYILPIYCTLTIDLENAYDVINELTKD